MEQTGQWHTVKELFQSALEQPSAERDEFLRHACNGDSALLEEVQSLLAALEHSPELSHAASMDWLDEAATPTSIGSYHLVRKLGSGGMGQVWLAEQTTPLHRVVALKLIRGALFDESLLSRFQSERQTLALMNHPAIAKVLDAGATPDGQPYFVMEYVAGVPITTYCDEHRLSIPQRLQLFTKVCEGVQHAHQKAIIHRDLKPANILVVEVDGVPTPRIIDFGLAKALAPDPAQSMMLTHMGAVVGTPAYMSPEQAATGAAAVDTRTDVYSLGVILYELLAGALPFEVAGESFEQVLRRLREEDPASPSARIRSDIVGAETSAENRDTQAKLLASTLRGDLDSITLKAIEKDQPRRYGSPAELATDIERYLNHQPVVARPATTGYRIQKYVRRHSVAVTVAAILVFLLAGFAVLQALELRRITHERDVATRERDRANRVTDFMTGMFKLSDPSETRGNTVTARELLDKASAEINAGLARDPELQAQMMLTMGTVYNDLGLYSRADPLLRKSIDLRTAAFGSNNNDTLSAEQALAWTTYRQGHFAQAEAADRQILAARRRLLGPEAPDTLRSMSDVAMIMNDEGHFAAAEALQRQTLEIRRRVLGEDNLDTAVSINNLATVLQLEGRYPEAEELNREAVTIRTRVLGAEHPDTLGSEGNLANVVYREGKYREAEQIDRHVLSERLLVYGADNPLTLQTMSNLANVLHREGNDTEAEKICRETLEAQRRVLGPEHPETVMSINNLTAILSKEKRYAEAAKLGEEALDIRRRVLGPEHPLTLRSMSNLADSLSKLGRWNDAEALLRQALAIQKRTLRPNHPDTALSTYNLACVLLHQGKRAQALAMLRDSVDHGLAKWIDLEIDKDPDLANLHSDPRFQTLVSYARVKAGQ